MNQDLQTTSSFVRSTIVSVTVVSLLAVYIAVVLGIFSARMISRPINSLTSTAEQIALGDLTVDEIKIKNRDEIGKLADAFNKMGHNLRELI